jgi:hypothetical protein
VGPLGREALDCRRDGERCQDQARRGAPKRRTRHASTAVVGFTRLLTLPGGFDLSEIRSINMSVPYDGKSTSRTVPGISGENTHGGTAVVGTSEGAVTDPTVPAIGVQGVCSASLRPTVTTVPAIGVQGICSASLNDPTVPAIGVQGVCSASFSAGGGVPTSIGVQGVSSSVAAGPPQAGFTPIVSIGVDGQSTSGDGVHGKSVSGNGVHGESTSGPGVFGSSQSGNAGQFQGNV